MNIFCFYGYFLKALERAYFCEDLWRVLRPEVQYLAFELNRSAKWTDFNEKLILNK
jgi:hypothetical protein